MASDPASAEFSALVEILAATIPDPPAHVEHKFPRVSTRPSPAERPPLALASEPVSGGGNGNMVMEAPGGESSMLADILTSAMRPRPAADGHEGLSSSYHARTEPDRVESLDRSLSGEVWIHDAAALGFVGRSLATVESCITLQAHSTGILMPLAVRHVLKAEMARATGLLQLVRFLKKDLSPATTTVLTDAIVQRVLQSVEAERRLRGITLASRCSASNLSLVVDEGLLANFLLGALLTTFALVDGLENPQVHLVVTRNDNGDVTMSVAQEQTTAPYGWPSHSVGEAWADSAGGVLGAISISAGEAIARAWGGQFAATAAERSTSISITLPVI